MTASLNAQVATPPVHDLSHSSIGAGRPFVPVSEMPSPFVPLGEVAAGVVADLATWRTDPPTPVRAPLEDLPLALADGGTLRQLVRCWAREEASFRVLMDRTGDHHHETPDCATLDRAIYLQGRNSGALRQIIISRQATNLVEVLLKTLVYMNCRCDTIEEALIDQEHDMVKASAKYGPCDEVVRDSIILDLLRMLKGSGLTVEDLCAEVRPHTVAA